MTSRASCGRPDERGQQVQLGEVLEYALAYPKRNTREISKHFGSSKSQVWKILSKLRFLTYRTTTSIGFTERDCQTMQCMVQVLPEPNTSPANILSRDSVDR